MQTKKCPFCCEEIKYDAIKCKHCGEYLHEKILVDRKYSPQINSYDNLQNSDISCFSENTKRWYTKKWLVLFLCLICFPVGIYGLWKGTSLCGWKFFLSILIAYIATFLLCIGIYILGDSMNKNESSFLNVSNSSNPIENNEIQFSANSASSSEDFNSFINKFISDSIYQRERTLKPYIFSNGIGDDMTQTSEMDLYYMTGEDIYEGERNEEGTTFWGEFTVISSNEIIYTRAIPETDNGLRLIFKLIQNEWMLVEYRIS